uniref:Uncharacterized protein n=1 Tax=Anguilla anguilla TaxID=7936 RepID=A0A0E9X535_ANGAN
MSASLWFHKHSSRTSTLISILIEHVVHRNSELLPPKRAMLINTNDRSVDSQSECAICYLCTVYSCERDTKYGYVFP